MRDQLTGALALLLCAACNGSGGGSSSDAAASGDSPLTVTGDGSSAIGDAGAESACPAPTPSMVPASWTRPSDCGGIGNLCSEGCGGGSQCQLIGDYCQSNGAPPGMCAPYCIGFACMTFDQASCFCTGDAGAMFGQCACGPAAVLGMCATEGAACDKTPCCSCGGLACVADALLGTKTCRQSCAQNSECATSCCDTAAHVCHDGLYCNCVDAGSGCGSTGPGCCPGATCLTFQLDAATPTFSCYANCAPGQTSCGDGGCCSLNITGKNYGACGSCQ